MGIDRKVVPLRMAVAEDRDDARTFDARRVVQHRVRETEAVELLHTRIAELHHLLFRSELQASGRTRFDARRLEADFDAIDAESALRHLARRLVELRHIERTTGRAIPAADARGRIHIDDTVGVLNDRAWRGTGGETSRLRAMHALVFAHEPHRTAVIARALLESNQVPELGIELWKRLIRALLMRGDRLEIVPFLTRRLARLAADAGSGVDVLRNGFSLANSGGASPHGSGGAADFHRLFSHRRVLTPSPDSRGTPCTPASMCSDRPPTASGNSPAVLRDLSQRRSPNESGLRCARCACRRRSSPAGGW